MEEIINLITAYLIELKNHKSDGRYSIRKIIQELGFSNLSYDDIFDIAKYMENLGLLKVIYVMGDAFVKLTPKGMAEFERKPQLIKENIFKKILDKKFDNELTDVLDEFNDPSSMKSKDVIIDYITNLLNDYIPKIVDWNIESYKTDLEILKLEVSKKTPDKDVIESKLYSLMDCIPLRSQIRELKSMFNFDK